jgi:hypothetical protein
MILVIKHFNPSLASIVGLVLGVVTTILGVITHSEVLLLSGGSSVVIGIARTKHFVRPGSTGTSLR